jgi:hypothetical protein
VRIPLNYFDKYLVLVTGGIKAHNYIDAQIFLDSLKVYASGVKEGESIIRDYEATKQSLINLQKTVDAKNNGTYYYSVNDLIDNLVFFIENKRVPKQSVIKALFDVVVTECNNNDTVFSRLLSDTSKNKSGDTKFEILRFHRQNLPNSQSAIVLLELVFFDDKSFSYYNRVFSQFTKSKSSKESIAYNFENSNNEVGREYQMSNPLVGGLTVSKLDRSMDRYTKKYRLYFYCITDGVNVKDLSPMFD